MPAARHIGLVVEDAAEVLAIGKDLVLIRQVGPAGIDQIEAGQIVLQRDFLGAQMLLYRQRIVGAALDRRIIDDDDHLTALDAADAGDDACSRNVAAIHVPGGKLADLEEWRAGIKQLSQPLARQQLPARLVPFACLVRPATLDCGGLVADIGNQSAQRAALALNVSEEGETCDWRVAMWTPLLVSRFELAGVAGVNPVGQQFATVLQGLDLQKGHRPASFSKVYRPSRVRLSARGAPLETGSHFLAAWRRNWKASWCIS